MARMVFCQKYGKEMEGLITPPYPGKKGQEIYQSISKQAWQEWQAHQTMLINEKHLNMMMTEDRSYLQTEMDKFLSNKDFDQAEESFKD